MFLYYCYIIIVSVTEILICLYFSVIFIILISNTHASFIPREIWYWHPVLLLLPSFSGPAEFFNFYPDVWFCYLSHCHL